LTKGDGKQSGTQLSEIEALKKRNRELEQEVAHSKKGDAYFRQRKLKRYAFIDGEKRNYPLKLLCRVMQVSASGYYAWRKRLTNPPCLKRRRLADLVKNYYARKPKKIWLTADQPSVG
jgi:hypothetical protein